METEQELNNKIIKKTLEIKESFPELYIFLDEMTVYNNDISPQQNIVSNSRLKSYYNSLDEMLNRYRQHQINQ